MRVLGLEDICIHQVCFSGQAGFAESLAALGRHGISLTAVWKPMLDEVGIATARRLLADHGIGVTSLCAAELSAGVDHCFAMAEQAAELGAASLVLISGGFDHQQTSLEAAREHSLEALSLVAERCKGVPLRLALEPLHPMVCGLRSVICSLAEANTMLDQLDSRLPGHQVGLAIDSYALWWEADIGIQLGRAGGSVSATASDNTERPTGNRILNYHVSDWLSETRDIRLDRGMPGDGIIALPAWRRQIEATGFSGPVEIEIFSSLDWWQRPADALIETVLERKNRFF